MVINSSGARIQPGLLPASCLATPSPILALEPLAAVCTALLLFPGTGKGRCLLGINSRWRCFSSAGKLTLGALDIDRCFPPEGEGLVAVRAGMFLTEHLDLVPQVWLVSQQPWHHVAVR